MTKQDVRQQVPQDGQGRASSQRRRQRSIPPQEKALRRLETAAVRDLKVARPIFEVLGAIWGSGREDLFPAYTASLHAIQRLPPKLRADARALIEWAIQSPGNALIPIIVAQRKLEQTVRRLRLRSPLGRHLRRRARQLMKLHPILKERTGSDSGTAYEVLPDAMGTPLAEGTLRRAAKFQPSHIQVLAHDAYVNSPWVPGVLTIRLHADGYTVAKIMLAVPRDRRAQSTTPGRRFEGELTDFRPNSAKGSVWMLRDDRGEGDEALQEICEGDHLTIFDAFGRTSWKGVIRCNRKVGSRSSPHNPADGRLAALGFWVDWIQAGFEPDEWAKFFYQPQDERCWGILVRPKPRSPGKADQGRKSVENLRPRTLAKISDRLGRRIANSL